VEPAHRRIAEKWPLLARALLLRVQALRIIAWGSRARASLALAEVRDEAREPRLREVERDARRIEGERVPSGVPLARLYMAGAAAVRGENGRASALAREAAERFDEAGMAMHAAAAWRAHGALEGGERGLELVRRSDAWLAAETVKDPTKLLRVVAPGFARFARFATS
jgi:hypothetical protein